MGTHRSAGQSLPARTMLPIWRCRCYRRLWLALFRCGAVLRPARVNLIIVGLLLLALCVPDQALDMFVSLAEDFPLRSSRVWQTLIIPWGAGVVLWFTTENVLHVFAPKYPKATVAGRVRRALPYLLSCGPSLAVSSGFVLARFSLTSPKPSLARNLWVCAGLSVSGLIVTVLMCAAIGSAVRRVESGTDCPLEMPHKPALAMRRRSRVSRRVLGWWTGGRHGDTMLSLPWGWGAAITVTTALCATLTPQYAQTLGPAAMLVFVAVSWAFLLNAVLLALRHPRVPLLTIVLGLAILAGLTDWNDNHSVRRVRGSSPAPPPDAVTALESWLRARPDYREGRPYPVIVVAAEGGGIRAAYWAAAVLTHLYDQHEAFRGHIFAVSGVSGGSVGAGVYAALVQEHAGEATPAALRPRAGAILSTDLLSPVLARACGPDLLQQIVPFPIESIDRAAALERSLEEAWRSSEHTNRFGRGFYHLRPADGHGNVPFLVLNTTEVETGERVPVSHLIPSTSTSGGFATFADVVPEDVPLSTAVFLSSRFPVVTPAGTVRLGDGRKLRFVDGGYYENSATATVLDLIHEIVVRDDDASPAPRRGPRDDAYFIVVMVRYIEDWKDPARSQHSFGDPMSPLRTLLQTREARAGFSRSQLERFLFDAAVAHRPVDPFVVTFEARDDAAHIPLGWALSAAARDVMDTALPDAKGQGGTETNRKAIDALMGELERSGPPPP